MLAEEKLESIKKFAATLNREEIIWLNGYLTALAGKLQQGNNETHVAEWPKKLTLVYGTETGNSKALAVQLAGIAKKKGVIVKLAGLDQYRISDIAKEENFFVIISTQGEGEPPLLAKKFYDHIHQNQVDLKKMKFGVLALGDSSYAQFCKTGEDVDARLEALGGHRILPLKKCDVDYEQDALHWIDNVIASLETNATAIEFPTITTPDKAKPAGKQTYKGVVVANINLNDRGSKKRTFHIEIACDEPIEYQPGDALGLIPQNKPEIVKNILALTDIDPKLEIQHTKVKAGAEELLCRHLNISYLLKSTIKQYAAISNQVIPDERMSLYDLLREYPLKDAGQFEEVIKILTTQSPRLYSISSSPAAHGTNEIHITVAKDQFTVADEKRSGVSSKFLSHLDVDSEIEFFIQRSKHFILPPPEQDLIMIGPGTGIAPFRSFLFERDAIGATGRNWLFFGEQHFVTDFLYQAELQNFLQTGLLTKIDVAFSRDQKEKIYVQHRMYEKGAELYAWLQNGAYIAISGKRDPMSKDVEQALLNIFVKYGNKTEEQSKQYLRELQDAGRYIKDVY